MERRTVDSKQMKEIEEQLTFLIKLQELDAQIYKLRSEKELKPQEIESLQEGYKSKVDELKVWEDSLKALQLKRKEMEVDLAAKEENVRKYQMQLYQIKTNKEYTSLQTEIENLKADNSILEEEIIKLLDKVDRAKEELAKKKETLVAYEKQLKEEELEIKGEMEAIDKELTLLTEKRMSLTPRLDSPLLAKYERILVGKSGLAMVPVVSDACGGCRMKLPPQVINEIKMKDDIVTCEVCSRILYIEE